MRLIINQGGEYSPPFFAPSDPVQLDLKYADLYSYVTGVVDVVEKNISNQQENLGLGSIWGNKTSIRDFGLSNNQVGLRGSFNLGKNSNSNESDTGLLPYFSKDGRLDAFPGQTPTHKGARYYISVDPSVPTTGKLEVIREDIHDALAQAPEGYGDENYLQYLGVIDHLRNHISTLYHSYTYKDRYELTENAEYIERRERIFNSMVNITQEYYLTLLGHKSGVKINSAEILSIVDDITNDLLERDDVVFKMPEIENSLKVLAFADLVTDKHPEIDVVVGAPSGGSETAIVTDLLYKIKNPNRERQLELLPISTHSASVKRDDEETTKDDIEDYIKANGIEFKGKNVLFVDDNSNTGRTLALAENIISNSGAENVICRVVEADPIRIQVKSSPGNVQPVPNPIVNECSVGFVPITRGAGLLSPDRQMLKIERQGVLRRNYNRIANAEDSPMERDVMDLRNQESRTEAEIKVCGVHNIYDAQACLLSGVRNFGIHLTYTPEEYKKKALAIDDPRVAIKMNKVHDFYSDRDLPLPWLELNPIRDMIDYLDESGIETNLFLLMRPKSSDEAIRILRRVIPSGSQQKVTLQLQGDYDAELVNSIREELKAGFENEILIVQMVALDEVDLDRKIIELNSDTNVDAVLVDSKKKGGTGEQGDIEQLVRVLGGVSKRKYLAGGLSSSNINKTLEILRNNGIQIEGLDLESSVELDEPMIRVKSDGSIVKRRKDPEKISRFVDEVELIEYMEITIQDTQFKTVLNQAWEFAKNETGYFNLDAAAEEFWIHASQEGLLTDIALSNKTAFINQFRIAASTYPAIPGIVREKLSRAEESDAFQEKKPQAWLNAGVGNFLSQIANAGDVSSIIWTAGDSVVEDYPRIGNYAMTEEQRLRYELSGLERLSNQIFAEHTGIEFIAHPDKLGVVEKRIEEWSQHGTIYVIDNDLENLRRFYEICNKHGVTNVQIIHIDGPLDGYSDRITNLVPGDLVIMDMDDVLLNGEFRKFHQPRNILKQLTDLGYYHE